VRASKDTRFVALLRAEGIDAPAALQVLGSLNVAPQMEVTSVGGATIAAGASLRHGCVDRDEPTLPFYDSVQRRLIEGAASGAPDDRDG
jgi:hypothetical protein